MNFAGKNYFCQKFTLYYHGLWRNICIFQNAKNLMIEIVLSDESQRVEKNSFTMFEGLKCWKLLFLYNRILKIKYFLEYFIFQYLTSNAVIES